MVTSPITLHAAPAAGFDEPFGMLADCHQRVERTLNLLHRLEQHLREQGADANARSAAADVLRYFDQAAPAHHEDEERHVLPVLRAAGDPALAALAERLHADHLHMAAAWAKARPSLAALAAGVPWAHGDAAETSLSLWHAFAGLYAAHLEAENCIAFPAAASRLTPPQCRAMGEEMAVRRGVARGGP